VLFLEERETRLESLATKISITFAVPSEASYGKPGFCPELARKNFPIEIA
jgi:hypothetical protein